MADEESFFSGVAGAIGEMAGEMFDIGMSVDNLGNGGFIGMGANELAGALLGDGSSYYGASGIEPMDMGDMGGMEAMPIEPMSAEFTAELDQAAGIEPPSQDMGMEL